MNEVDTYINNYDGEILERLILIRESVKELAPEATERICMNMPTFDYNGKWFVHFAAFKNHIGFYPQPEGVAAFEEKLSDYKTSKGAIQFPLDQPLPIELIREIIAYRYKQENERD